VDPHLGPKGPQASVGTLPLSPGALQNLLARSLTVTETPVVIADALAADHPLSWVNAAFETVSGYRAGQLLGRNARVLQGPRTAPSAIVEVGLALREHRPIRPRLLNYRPDGSTWWNEMHLCPVRDDQGILTHVVGVHQDVSAEVAAGEQAQHAATHDPLTGLLNRATFVAQVTHELARSARDRRSAAVLFLDIDGFKEVNDRFGHPTGDALLVQIGQRLRARLRAEDVIARFGGDEFLVLAVDLAGDGDGDGDGDKAADAVTADITRALAEPFALADSPIPVSVSIGAALSPRDGSSSAELIAAADAAMYRRKHRRRRDAGLSLSVAHPSQDSARRSAAAAR